MATTRSARSQASVLGSYPTLVEPERPSNADLHKICIDTGHAIRLILSNDLANRTRSADPLLTSFQGFLSKRGASSRKIAVQRAKAFLASPIEVQKILFGRYAGLSVKEGTNNSLQSLSDRLPRIRVNAISLGSALDIGRLNEYIEPLPTGIRFSNDLLKYRNPKDLAASLDKSQGAKYKKLGFFIKKVKCIEETDEVGADEIAVGGSKTNPDGSTHLINQFMIDDNFDKGETKTFSGNGRKFAEWNLVTDAGYPQVYGAVMVMAEKDDGGFHKFLVELWKMVGDFITKKVGQLTGAAIGALLGSAFAGLGAVIGAAIGWIIGEIVKWIIELFDNPDDIVATKTFLLGLGAATKSYYEWAKLLGPQTLSHTIFSGDGGRYAVWWQYRVY